MRATIKVHSESACSHLNGQIFEIKDFMPNDWTQKANFGLDVNGTITDFTASEIFIEELEQEYQAAYDNNNFHGTIEHGTIVRALYFYCQINNLNFTPVYNCPA